MVAGVYIVKNKPIDALIANIRESSLNYTQTASTENNTEDDDIVAVGSFISLICPVGQCRIKIPAKSKSCKHAQCFDLFSFLELNKSLYPMKCPVCSIIIDSVDKLIVDLKFEKALESIPEKFTQFYINHDGTFDLSLLEKQSENSTNESICPTPNSKKRKNVFEIIDSDSESFPEDIDDKKLVLASIHKSKQLKTSHLEESVSLNIIQNESTLSANSDQPVIESNNFIDLTLDSPDSPDSTSTSHNGGADRSLLPTGNSLENITGISNLGINTTANITNIIRNVGEDVQNTARITVQPLEMHNNLDINYNINHLLPAQPNNFNNIVVASNRNSGPSINTGANASGSLSALNRPLNTMPLYSRESLNGRTRVPVNFNLIPTSNNITTQTSTRPYENIINFDARTNAGVGGTTSTSIRNLISVNTSGGNLHQNQTTFIYHQSQLNNSSEQQAQVNTSGSVNTFNDLNSRIPVERLVSRELNINTLNPSSDLNVPLNSNNNTRSTAARNYGTAYSANLSVNNRDSNMGLNSNPNVDRVLGDKNSVLPSVQYTLQNVNKGPDLQTNLQKSSGNVGKEQNYGDLYSLDAAEDLLDDEEVLNTILCSNNFINNDLAGSIFFDYEEEQSLDVQSGVQNSVQGGAKSGGLCSTESRDSGIGYNNNVGLIRVDKGTNSEFNIEQNIEVDEELLAQLDKVEREHFPNL
ncbi:hypothetical protein BB560_003917 [Smittium megazygosporum]|uniref:SP-RING-type domain-containing protein n=1 Tax=Smittium megazygosporum TaxID=133381 RepID=A0A2T9ZAP7_9FUNG|nr:hypothetical protein BB560_003917 [Smittium megazygosporum]